MTERARVPNLLHRFRSILSFSKSKEDLQNQIKNVTGPAFFEDEKIKVEEIKNLLDNGEHDVALGKLLSDFANEDGIQYFNRVRYFDDEDNNGLRNKLEKNVDLKPSKPKKPDCLCSWQGFSSSHKALKCTNSKMLHPWKTVLNVCGIEEQVKTEYCQYHQKFCVDESKRHIGRMIRIKCANKYALCTECFILKEGKAPQLSERIPGLNMAETKEERKIIRRNTSMIQRHFDGQSNEFLDYQETSPKEIDGEEQQNDFWVQVVSAKIIQCKWRKHKIDVEKELREYENYNHQNSAAVKIQRSFRCCMLKSHLIRANTSKNIVELSKCEHEEAEVKQKRDILQLRCSYIVDNRGYLDNDEDRTDVTLQPGGMVHRLKSTNQPYKISDQIDRIDRSKSIQNRKCTLSVCRLCNKIDDERTQRCRVISRSFFHTKELLNTRKIVADEDSFRSMDPFQLGSISQRKFLYIIKKLWNDAGYPLLPGETRSILSKFDCRNGLINYEEYLDFADQQMIPCQIHSRFVCTSPLCNSLLGKHKQNKKHCLHFSPAKPSSNLCVCGEYITHHTITPRHRKSETRKRGLNIFSAEDMKRTFVRKTAPDVQTDVQFNRLRFCKSINTSFGEHIIDIEEPSKIYTSKQNDERFRQNLDTTLQPKEKPQQKNLNEATPSAIKSDNTSFNVNSSIEDTELIPYTSYSPETLSIMLKECIKYRIPSVEKKPVVVCPLCKHTFFDEIMLKNHLLRRHTKKEIEHDLHIATKAQPKRHEHIHVQWIGTYITVPPLPSPIPINICYNHVPPHPKCLKCNESIEKCPLFPPIRFYSSAFVQHDINISTPASTSTSDSVSISSTSTGDDSQQSSSDNRRTFHFHLDSNDFGIVLENGKIAKIEALCEDAFCKYFIGIKYYYSHTDFYHQLIKNRSSNSNSSPSSKDFISCRHSDMDENNELILDSKVSWVEMKDVVDRCYVFTCSKSEFLEKKRNMGLSLDDESTDGIKFCQMQWTGDELQEIPTPS